MTWWSSTSLSALAWFAAASAEPVFGLPVACSIPDDCSVQKYVDLDPGEGRLDHLCGRFTTDGHGGTDFRLNRFSDLGRGVAVLAAADGEVLRVRDGEPDRVVSERSNVAGREAGNAVVIAHGDGWETQYSHLAEGSLSVRVGQTVAKGERIGAIGLSGLTEYPHLHFEVRRSGEDIDPFAPQAQNGSCHTAGESLWEPEVAAVLAMEPGRALAAGFAPGAEEARAAPHNFGAAPAALEDPEALVLWGVSSGTRPEDLHVFRIFGPDGEIVHERSRRVGRTYLEARAFSGFRLGDEHTDGLYRGLYMLQRNENSLGTVEIAVTVRRQP